MTFDFAINKALTRAFILVTLIVFVTLLAYGAWSSFVVGLLTDERGTPAPDMLADAARHFPGSARLNARLAQYELESEDRDLSLARSYAARAVELSPRDFNYWLLMASIEEARGNRGAAEHWLRKALALAPNNADVHCQMANLLLRESKADESVSEFRKATAENYSLLRSSLDLIWRATGGSVSQVEAATGDDPRARLVLAQFLLKQSRVPEAVNIFSNLDREQRLQSTEASAFLSTLINLSQLPAARQLWVDTVSSKDAIREQDSPLIWNGGFEADATENFPQFDWNFRASQYARISIGNDVAHTGSRSLRIDFSGRDTTRLDGEIKQLVAVKPGHHYRVECYAKTDQLVTPEGPRLAIVDSRTSRQIAASDSIRAGSSDWAQVRCQFIAPVDCQAVLIEIRRLPKFSYDDPTEGTVWVDDFALKELSETR